MKKRIAKHITWGVIISALTMLLSHEHCMDGPGRGLPFAAYSPECGAWLFLKLDESKIPQVFDFGALTANVLFWSLVSGAAASFINRRKHQLFKEQAELNKN